MLKIASIRAHLGKGVTAKLKNEKDDQQRILEFKLSELSLTHLQLSQLVACSEHERPFAEVAFRSKSAMSELRHFKKIELGIEVQSAVLTIELVGSRGDPVQIQAATLKNVSLSFTGNELCEMACKVWSPLDPKAHAKIAKWTGKDVFVSVDSPRHGEEDPGPNNEMDLPAANVH